MALASCSACRSLLGPLQEGVVGLLDEQDVHVAHLVGLSSGVGAEEDDLPRIVGRKVLQDRGDAFSGRHTLSLTGRHDGSQTAAFRRSGKDPEDGA